MSRPALLLLVIAAATGALVLWRARDGRLRTGPAVGDEAATVALTPEERSAFGVPADAAVTLLVWSSAFCAPCRATKRLAADVAALVPGVAVVEVDAEAHLEAVRRHRIMRTPTTFVLDAGGHVVVRASGQPRKADLVAAVGQVLASPRA